MSEQQDPRPPAGAEPPASGEQRRAPGPASARPTTDPSPLQLPQDPPSSASAPEPPPPRSAPQPGHQPPPQDYPPGYPPPPPGYAPPAYGQPPQYWQQPAAMRPEEERLWSTLTHLSYFVFGLLVPLIVMLTLGTRSAYVRHHAVEALNFHITLWIAGFVAGLTIFLVIGVLLLPAVLVAGAVFTIIAAVKAYQGVPYRYPLSIRLVR